MNFSVGDKRYIISDAAKMIEVESHVLRYWEEELEVEVPRNEMGHRYYTDYYIELFKKIKELKDGGFQLKAIKMILPELMEINGNSAGTGTYITLKDELFEKLMRSSEYNTVTKSDNHQVSDSDSFMSGYINHGIVQQDNENGYIKAEHNETDTTNAKKEIAVELQERAVSEQQQDIVMVENESNPVEANSDEKENGTSEVIKGMQKNNKIEQFQMIIMEVVSNALKENNGNLGKEVSELVSDTVIKEMDFLLQMKERQEEERFRRLDETIRNYQLQNREKSKSNKGFFVKRKKL